MNRRLMAWLLPGLLIAVPVGAAENGNEIEAMKTQIKNLSQKVERLEAEQQAASTDAGSAMAENTGNPSISVVGTFAGSAMRGSGGIHGTSFFPLSEGEIIFGADVDPHTRLDITVTAANGGMAVEEGFLTSRLPAGFRLRAGRKFIPFGRSNAVHPHALVYVDVPNGLLNLFGPEKFTGEGIFVDHPLFIGDSVHQFTIGFFRNANSVAFDPAGANRYTGMGRWTGLWDMSDTATLEIGSTFVSGRNGIAGGSRTDVLGGQFAIKSKAFDHSGWSLEGEWNRSRINRGSGAARTMTNGAYLLGEYDFNRNWLLFGRYDFSRSTGFVPESAYSAGGAWKVSEFQSLTLQYKHTQNALAQTAANLGIAAGGRANELLFRWVVAIGPHHAHSY